MNLQCPLCALPLEQDSSHSPCKRLYCAQGHSFDRAKQGYFHLLPVQFKRSKDPGDDKQMVSTRQMFLSAGYYQAISDQLNTLCSYLLNHSANHTIADIGCGEGYYTDRLQQSLANEADQKSLAVEITGIDISKHAIQAACRRNRNTSSVNWLVATSAHLPFADNSIDLLISLFTPLQESEINRVLSDQGRVVIVSSGVDHLLELREHLYDSVRKDIINPLEQLKGFEADNNPCLLELTKNLRYSMDLESQTMIQALLTMTPHYWRATKQKKEQLEALTKLNLIVDVNFHCLLKRPSQTSTEL